MRPIVLFLALMLCVPAVAQYTIKESKAFQKELDGKYRGEGSPLKPEDKRHFKKLPWYKADARYIVEARLERTPEDSLFRMKTTTDRLPEYRRYGILHFQIDGQPFQLNVYQSPEVTKKPGLENHLFLPFKDLSSGEESYGGGRYIDLRVPEGDMLIIDFNRAYNPLCAYNEKYSCPIVPAENFLEIYLRAGVMAPEDH
jgi:uncharacterized protein